MEITPGTVGWDAMRPLTYSRPFRYSSGGDPLSASRGELALCVALLVGGADPALAQLLLDWPVRSGPEPEALLTGAAAAAWNPAGMSPAVGGSRGVWLVHLDGPDAVGISGVEASASARLPWVGTAGLAYRHLGLTRIPRTSTSPDPEPGDIRLSEDVFTFALARGFGSSSAMGLAVRYARASGGPDEVGDLALDYGLIVTTDLPLRPRVGALVRDIGSHPRLLAALGFTPPRAISGPLTWDVTLGLDADRRTHVTESRLSLRGTWRGRYHAAAGLNRNGVDGWTTLWMLGADIDRYSLAVMREGLANGFGVAHYYRLGIRLP